MSRSNIHFTIDRHTNTVTKTEKTRIRTYNLEDIQHIRHISITAAQSHHQGSSTIARTHLLDARGLWESSYGSDDTTAPLRHEYWVARGTTTRSCTTEGEARTVLSSPHFVAISLREQILDALMVYENWERFG